MRFALRHPETAPGTGPYLSDPVQRALARGERVFPPPPKAPGPWSLGAWLGRLFGADRRRDPRYALRSATARVDGALVRVLDVSRGGMRLSGYRGSLSRQDRFTFELYLVEPPHALELRGEGVVAWRAADRLGAAFYGLSVEDRARLERFLALTGGPMAE